VSRLEQTLNKPIVVLVVGVVAVALNVLLYFGLFVPRMTPLIAHINPIGSSLPEAISKLAPESGPEANSKSSDSKAGGKSDSEANSKYSASEAGSKSGPEASSIYSASEAGSKSGPEESLESVSDSPSAGSPSADSPSADSPSGSLPELPPPPPPQQQYQ
jgi:hypothetical protein